MCLTGIICNPDDFEDLYQHVDKTMKYVKNISSETLSNSAIIGKNNYLIDGKENEKLFWIYIRLISNYTLFPLMIPLVTRL